MLKDLEAKYAELLKFRYRRALRFSGNQIPPSIMTSYGIGLSFHNARRRRTGTTREAPLTRPSLSWMRHAGALGGRIVL